jgi:bifunctional non-homologous end joining protein LigD
VRGPLACGATSFDSSNIVPLLTFGCDLTKPCIPTVATTAPTGPEWLHELKHDGFRLIVSRDGDRVLLFTRRGYDWSGRFPRIIDQARRLKARTFVIDAEAVFCDDTGMPDFDRLMSRRVDADVFGYGFDLLALDGEDLRTQPLEIRKAKLFKLLARSDDGIVLSEHMDGELGSVMFKHACRMGLEGIVSKRRDKPYVAGRCKHCEGKEPG